MIRTLPILTLALAISAPVYAQDSELIDCMAGGYTAEQQDVIDDYVATFDLATMGQNSALGDVLAVRMVQCAGAKVADEEKMMALIEHRFAVLSEQGILATRPDAGEALRRIDEDLPAETRERFYRIFEAMIFGEIVEGQEPDIGPADEKFFGEVILMPPVNGTEEQSELIGALMATRAMQRVTRTELAGD